MKKLFALLAIALGVVACQKDHAGMDVNMGGEQEVLINVSLPEETRANSAVGGITNVIASNDYTIRYIFQVYNANETESKAPVYQYTDAKTASFPVRLVPGRDYRFVVWADIVNETTKADFHYNTTAFPAISLNPTWAAMDETRDAYTVSELVTDFHSGKSITLTLKRPLAKLRVITTDMKELLGLTPESATVTYTTKHYNAFNALSSVFAGEIPAAHTYSIAAYDDNTNTDKVLFTDYFFANEEVVKFNMDVMMSDNNTVNRSFTTDIPVKRNYLTTIMGDILTDGNNIVVNVEEEFQNGSAWNPEDDKQDVEIWDGLTVSEPAYNDATKTYTVKNGAELAWIADQVNGVTRAASNSFKNTTIVLDRNINLGGNEWTPIGGTGKHFEGTFDGKGFIVGNFQILKQEGKAGLFGSARATIKNLTVKDVTIAAHHYAGAIVGQGYVRFENCHVDNINITVTTKDGDLGDKVGGIIGQNCEGGLYVKNSSAKNVTIKGYRDLGGIAGMAHNNNTVSGCSVENISIIQDLSVNYQNETPTTLGAVIGRKGTNVTEENNTVGEGINITVLVAEGLTKDVVNEEYTVTSAEGLQTIVEIVEEETDATIVLGGDIDLSAIATRAISSNFSPIGNKEVAFTGTFDGQGYTISNLVFENDEDEWYIGLFGNVKNATIKNININNAFIHCDKGLHIAALVGNAEGNTVIENVNVTGDVKVYGDINNVEVGRIGVIVGGNYGTHTLKDITINVNEGSFVEGNSSIGGVAGQLQGVATFENVTSNIDVRAARFFAGGIIGLTPENSTFTNCSTSGDITLTAGTGANSPYRLGGIAGGWADNNRTTLTLTGCSYEGTLTSGDVTSFDLEGYVGRGYSAVVGAKTILNGKEYVYAGNGEYYYVGKIVEAAGQKAVIFTLENGVKAVSVAEQNLKGKTWQNAIDWAAGLGEGWALASMEELNAIYDLRCELNDVLEADNAENALFWEGDELYIKNGSVYYALYMSCDEAPAGELDPQGKAYGENQVFLKFFNDLGYNDYLYSSIDCINKYAPLRDNYFARGVYSLM